MFADLTYRQDRSRAWSLFLASCMQYFGRTNFMFPDLSGPPRFDDLYQQESKGFNDEERKTAYRMVGALILIYQEGIALKGWTDYLGEFYTIEILGGGKASALGQFFTPEDVCTVMAEITLKEIDIETIDGSKRFADPSSGSGRTLLASAHVLGNKGLFPFYYAVDIDYTSVLMSCINFALHGLRGYVIRGNSLSLEYFTGYRIGGWVEQLNPFNEINQGIYKLDPKDGRRILGTAGVDILRYKEGSVSLQIERNDTPKDILL